MMNEARIDRVLIGWRRVVILFVLLLAALFCGASLLHGQTDNTIYVKNYSGLNVGAKVATAMQACSPNLLVPCILVVDPSLAVMASGSMPAMCSHCFLLDYRAGIPSSGGSGAWGGITGIIGNQTDLMAALAAKGTLSGALQAGHVITVNPTATGLVDSGQSLATFDGVNAPLIDVWDLHEGSGSTFTGNIAGNVCNFTAGSTPPVWSGKSLQFSPATNVYITCPTITAPVMFQVVVSYPPTTTQNYQAFAGVGTHNTNGFQFYPGVWPLYPTLQALEFDNNVTLGQSVSSVGNQVQVLTWSGGLNSFMYMNTDQVFTTVAGASIGNFPMPVGSPFTVGGSDGKAFCDAGVCQLHGGSIYGFLVYGAQAASNAATTGLVTQNQAAWASVLANHGVTLGKYVNNFPATNAALVCGITSIEAGKNLSTFPCAAANTGLSTTAYSVFNVAFASSTAGAWLANGYKPYAPWAVPTAGKRIAFLGDVTTNDLCQISPAVPNVTPAAAWQLIQQSVDQVKKLGFSKVLVGTMISRSGNGAGPNTASTCDALKNQINALIRNGGLSVGYTVVDLAADSRFADGGYAVSACYQVDGVHPTALCDGVYGALLGRVILAEDGATEANPTLVTSNAYAMTTADVFTVTTTTAASTPTLPECLGLTGKRYNLTNVNSGSFAATVSGFGAETITGSNSIAANATGMFRVMLSSPTAGGCYWLRVS